MSHHRATLSRQTTRAATIAAALLALSATTASAQPRPVTPEQGRAIAERLCTNCHITDSQKPGVTIPAGSPSFLGIANRPDQTYERIVGTLLQPHKPMPDTQLTREEILNLFTYIESLRRKDLTPLLPPPGEELPKRPAAPAKS